VIGLTRIISVRARTRLVSLALAAACVMLATQPTRAQTPPPRQDPPGVPVSAAIASTETAVPPATLVYANRPIVVFRATTLSRTPAERAAAATYFIDRLVDASPSARVTTQSLGDAATIRVGDTAVFAILPADVNSLAGETLDSAAATAASRLQVAFEEAVELHNPSRLLRAVGLALAATLLFVVLVWTLHRAHRAGRRRLNQTTERQLERLAAGADIVRASKLPEFLLRGMDLLSIVLAAGITYSWITFVLRRFPYTRPWGESLRSALMSAALSVARQLVDYLPSLLTVCLIILAARFIVRLSNYVFDAAEHGRIDVPWLYPEIAQPTKRIVAAILWLLALVVAYPHLPGSSSEAFKGVSVFVGLMVSLGSSGIMNQIMSGLTLTYSRAVRVGDFVKIGDIEGTVEQLGVLSVKIKTPRREEITIPNALVVATSTTNYSRFADREGVLVSTAVTIGYDTPWRQVEALLLLAANRTAGVRREPAPMVRQTALSDFYVHYTLLVCPERPHLRVSTLHALHANILDAFNEYGVQITSPNYEADPGAPKVVPPSQWYAAPAAPPTPAARDDAAVSVGLSR
jgi:small-conductance mechanosensitive channel